MKCVGCGKQEATIGDFCQACDIIIQSGKQLARDDPAKKFQDDFKTDFKSECSAYAGTTFLITFIVATVVSLSAHVLMPWLLPVIKTLPNTILIMIAIGIVVFMTGITMWAYFYKKKLIKNEYISSRL